MENGAKRRDSNDIKYSQTYQTYIDIFSCQTDITTISAPDQYYSIQCCKQLHQQTKQKTMANNRTLTMKQ